MKNIAEKMHDLDRENFRRVAANLPEVHDEKQPVEQVAQIINTVFTQLMAAFPAALAGRDQGDMNEIRRQWVMAFRENGITTLEQVAAGMRAARRQEKPFLPSPGQFVAWCKDEGFRARGLPEQDELYDMVMDYCAKRYAYPTAEEYPWQSSACYWMVTKLHDLMRSLNLNEPELRRRCGDELRRMARRIESGEEIPAPVVQIPVLHIPLSNEKGLAKIAELRSKFKLRGVKS